MANTSLAQFHWPACRPPLEKYKLDYGIGIVGYAGIIRAQQLPAYRLAGYRVAAAADIREDRREMAGRDGIPHVYADYRELIARDDVAIVDVAVDHSDMRTRIRILKDAAKAGKAVMMHKPMALDLATAEEMVRIAADAGIPYAINQNLRFNPAIYAAKQFLSPECFGAPGFLHVANISIEGPPFGLGPDGVVMAWQIHAIDSLRWLSGGEATAVTCLNRNNAALYQIEFSNGAACNYFEYHNEKNFRNETPFRAWAEKGALRGNHRWNPGSRWERELLEVRGYDWPEEVGWVHYNLPDDQTFRNVHIAPCFDHGASIGGFIGSMGEFMQSIHEQRPALTNGRDNLQSLRIYFAGQVSAAERRTVDPRELR
jgi:predicted dehydrogenase